MSSHTVDTSVPSPREKLFPRECLELGHLCGHKAAFLKALLSALPLQRRVLVNLSRER